MKVFGKSVDENRISVNCFSVRRINDSIESNYLKAIARKRCAKLPKNLVFIKLEITEFTLGKSIYNVAFCWLEKIQTVDIYH